MSPFAKTVIPPDSLVHDRAFFTVRFSFHSTKFANFFATWGNIMRVHGRYWLDYDSVAFAALMIALGIVELLVLGV
jgi:hypothetical protein